jgi:hypothetical protein
MQDELDLLMAEVDAGKLPDNQQLDRFFGAVMDVIRSHAEPVVPGYSSPALPGRFGQSVDNIATGQRTASLLGHSFQNSRFSESKASEKIEKQSNALQSLITYAERCDDINKAVLALVEIQNLSVRLIQSALESGDGSGTLLDSFRSLIDRAKDIFANTLSSVLGSDVNPVALGLLVEQTIPGPIVFSEPTAHYDILDHFVALCPSRSISPMTILGILLLREEGYDYDRQDSAISACMAKLPLASCLEDSLELKIARPDDMSSPGLTLSDNGLALAVIKDAGEIEAVLDKPTFDLGEAKVSRIKFEGSGWLEFRDENNSLEDHVASLGHFFDQITNSPASDGLSLKLPLQNEFFAELRKHPALRQRMCSLVLELDSSFLDLAHSGSSIKEDHLLSDSASGGLLVQEDDDGQTIEISGTALDDFFSGNLHLFVSADDGSSTRLGDS